VLPCTERAPGAWEVTVPRGLENAVVETNDAFAALDPKAFYDKIQQLNEARQAKRDAEAAAQESAAPEETGTPEESGAPEATGTPAGSPAAE